MPSQPDNNTLSLPVKVALYLFFFLAPKVPVLFKVFAKPLAQIALWYSPAMRRAIAKNASYIFTEQLSKKQLRKFSRNVVINHYKFVIEIAQGKSANWWRRQIATITGRQEYEKMRSGQNQLSEKDFGRGAILVTVHMGAFEAGLAALREVEENVHVVFQRDSFSGFEKARANMRNELNINELPIDDGLDTLLKIRTALRNNHVVVMQGDRAMKGQKSVAAPFLNGLLRLPVGAILLARTTGCQLVPVCVTRNNKDKFQLHLGSPIAPLIDKRNFEDCKNDQDFNQLRKALEQFVRDNPSQWLALSEVFEKA